MFFTYTTDTDRRVGWSTEIAEQLPLEYPKIQVNFETTDLIFKQVLQQYEQVK